MIPTNSSGSTNGCDNISSNCVIWQGPDISCIDLCNGDSISEVVFKLATKVCDLLESGVDVNPNLEGLDLTCLNIRGVTPTELVPVLQAMINQICLNADSGGGGNEKSNSLPIMTLPACMQYDDKSGNPVTQLPLDEFATLIANQVCDNLASINTINSTLSSLNARIDVLEACVLPCSGGVVEAQIVPTCVSNVGNLTNVSVVVLALESAFCELRNAVGFPSAINSAISQSAITGSYTQLSNRDASYSGIVGWNNSASTLAQSMQNAWVVLDDMYAAITDIQTNCCPGGCDGIIFSYSTANTISGGTGLITDVVFNFINSSIPSTFNDSAGFSKITIVDAKGVSTQQIVSVSSLQNNSTGISINVASLDTAGDLNATVEFSVTDGNDTCTAIQSSIITGIIPCPSMTLSSITENSFNFQFNNLLGSTATYLIEVINSFGTVIASDTVNNPGSSVTGSFSGLIPQTIYNVRLTVSISGSSNVCPDVPVETLTADAPCSQGMDVVFLVDYTSSMTSQIQTIQSGAANLVSTIDSSSGSNNYRIGLTTVDETTGDPNYGTCADYTALPTTQRLVVAGSAGTNLIYTAWEMFANDNGTAFTTQLNKLAGGVDGTCINMGSGAGGAEPMDLALQQVVGGAAFNGAFRNNVAKYVILITDNLPGGDEDIMNMTTYSRILSLITTCNNNGIKVFCMGAGVDMDWDNGGTISPAVYPWRELATGTGATYTTSTDPSTISSLITSGCGGGTPLT